MIDHLEAYVAQVNGDAVEGMKKYLDDYVYGPKGWNDFLSMIGMDEILAASRRGRSIFDD
jgi:glutaconate CoA-transferase subunit A